MTRLLYIITFLVSVFGIATPVFASEAEAETPTTPEDPEPEEVVYKASGTLPVLYINVYGEEGFDNEIIRYDLEHKDYFDGEYYLDTNGCEWLEALGAENIGSADEPLPLEIKARGNFTRKAYSKKPFKLKLGKKQSLLGMTKSKHFALLPHADDPFAWLRNFTAFNLGKRIGLPWTPWQQPVELVINNDYRGLYMLTESIRVDSDRIDIAELDDNEEDPELVTGGYIVEIDNYIEENQICIAEKSCVPDAKPMKMYVTYDTPEEYSPIQKSFVSHQLNAMNDAIGACNDSLWSYMDLDDAARYYLVVEMVGHTEAYSGSTYLFRDRGEGQKWLFSPLWDCGHAFDAVAGKRLFADGKYSNHWIASICMNPTFQSKVEETWLWFMSNCFDGLYEEMELFTSRISEGAKCDAERWRQVPSLEGYEAFYIADNSDVARGYTRASNILKTRLESLKELFGDYSSLSEPYAEPLRDSTPAAALPDLKGELSGVAMPTPPAEREEVLFDLQGRRVTKPARGGIYISPGVGKVVL